MSASQATAVAQQPDKASLNDRMLELACVLEATTTDLENIAATAHGDERSDYPLSPMPDSLSDRLDRALGTARDNARAVERLWARL